MTIPDPDPGPVTTLTPCGTVDEVFDEFDLSGDGTLELYEFEKRMSDMNTSQMALGLAQNALRHLSWRQVYSHMHAYAMWACMCTCAHERRAGRSIVISRGGTGRPRAKSAER